MDKRGPRTFKTQEMCNEAVRIEPRSLAFVPDKLKTEKMRNETVRREQYTLDCVLDHLKTQKCATRQCAWNHAP